MNRILTTLVQLMLVGGVIACVRLMWRDIVNDVNEMKDALKK